MRHIGREEEDMRHNPGWYLNTGHLHIIISIFKLLEEQLFITKCHQSDCITLQNDWMN